MDLWPARTTTLPVPQLCPYHNSARTTALHAHDQALHIRQGRVRARAHHVISHHATLLHANHQRRRLLGAIMCPSLGGCCGAADKHWHGVDAWCSPCELAWLFLQWHLQKRWHCSGGPLNSVWASFIAVAAPLQHARGRVHHGAVCAMCDLAVLLLQRHRRSGSSQPGAHMSADCTQLGGATCSLTISACDCALLWSAVGAAWCGAEGM